MRYWRGLVTSKVSFVGKISGTALVTDREYAELKRTFSLLGMIGFSFSIVTR